MKFDMGIEINDQIYLIEHFSRCFMSVHIPSGDVRIESYLPWKYTQSKIGMLLLKEGILINSMSIDHFFIYDFIKQQVRILKLQGMKADDCGYYFSNVLINQDELIVLPFRDKEIKRYGMHGELKIKDSQWIRNIFGKCEYASKMCENNIRRDSACISRNWLFFSLVYGGQNYLCKYNLEQKEGACEIIYCSKDVPIRGVYTYSDKILFRRIFEDKTEIVLMDLYSNEQRTIKIDCPTMFEQDVYGGIDYIRASFKNVILRIEGKDSRTDQSIYYFEEGDTYIANGILFNTAENKILKEDRGSISEYSIEKAGKKIKSSAFYLEGYRKDFQEQCFMEGKYILKNLVKYLDEDPCDKVEKDDFIKGRSIGEEIWMEIVSA